MAMDEKQELVPFLDDAHSQHLHVEASRIPKWSSTRIAAISAMVLATVVFVTASATVYIMRQRISKGPFRTDVRDAWPAVQYEQRHFTGALKFDKEKDELYREHDAAIEYFGPPSAEIDAAWDVIFKDEFVPMTPEEKKPFEPELRNLWGMDHAMFEPAVFHSLHCLNVVRKQMELILYDGTIDRDFYTASELAHTEHCLDLIRQSLICHGDLTPSPLYSWEGVGVALGASGAHTCRKWEPIKQWKDSRAVPGM